MTRHRGYKEKSSKYGVETPSALFTKYGIVIVKDSLVREDPAGKVIEILSLGDKVEILSELDSKWVQVATPSGRVGVAGKANIEVRE